MNQVLFTVASNRPIARDVWELRLTGDTSHITAPGQFVNLHIDGCYLRRPLSVGAVEDGQLTLIYKVVGRGTELLTHMTAGQTLDALSGLGNGFDLSSAEAQPLLVGGGVRVVPLYQLGCSLKAAGTEPTVVLGFNSADDVFYQKEFEALAETRICTADGTAGRKGFVTDAIGDLTYSYFYACGPEPMFRALDRVVSGPGDYSF